MTVNHPPRVNLVDWGPAWVPGWTPPKIQELPGVVGPIKQVPTGWSCPRCGRVNAPWISQCPCSLQPLTVTCVIQ